MTIDVSTQHKPRFITASIQNMILEMSGGQLSFLKQLCVTLQNERTQSENQNHSPLLKLIDHLLDESTNGLKERWAGLLHSFSNQQVFQAIAELVSVGELMKVGWTTQEWTNDLITLRHKDGKTCRLLTLSFILQRDLESERIIQENLIRQINLLNSKHQVGITIRKPLNHHLEIQKATRMVEFWLEAVNPAKKSTHSGYIRDDYNWFDIRYLGKRAENDPIVEICIPPLIGRQMFNIITQTADKAVEKVRRSNDKQPIILSVVTNQATQISPRGWQFLLYGQQRYQSDSSSTLDGTQFGGWLQDPFRTGIVGVLKMEQIIDAVQDEHCFNHTTYCNPWSEHKNFEEYMPSPRVEVISGNTPYWDIHLA